MFGDKAVVRIVYGSALLFLVVYALSFHFKEDALRVEDVVGTMASNFSDLNQ